MASSFITKDNIHGFWVDDAIMQVACWGIVNVIDNSPSLHKHYWLKTEFRECVYDNMQGIFVGFMDIHLDDFLITEERRNLLNEVVTGANFFFLNKGEFISTDELNSFQLIKETKREWIFPLETKRLIKLLDYIADVINDNISIRESDEINYEF